MRSAAQPWGPHLPPARGVSGRYGGTRQIVFCFIFPLGGPSPGRENGQGGSKPFEFYERAKRASRARRSRRSGRTPFSEVSAEGTPASATEGSQPAAGDRFIRAVALRLSMGRRRKQRLVVIPFTSTIVLGTLASADVIGEDLLPSQTLGENFFCYSLDGSWSKQDNTVGEGPIRVGLADPDLTDAEVEEHLEVSAVAPEDRIDRERSGRWVRKVGSFSGELVDDNLNDGVVIRTKVRRLIHEGQSPLRFWAWNESGAALTTGTNIRLSGNLYGRWVY